MGDVLDNISFIALSGSVTDDVKLVRDTLTEGGFQLTHQYNLDLSATQARRFLEAGVAEAQNVAQLAAEAVKSPKKKSKAAEPEPSYAEVLHESELNMLTESRVAFIAVQIDGGAEAVEQLRSIVGPEDPAQWADHPDSLRARFGGSAAGEDLGATTGASAGAGGSSADEGTGPFNQVFTAFSPDHAKAMIALFQQFEMQHLALTEVTTPTKVKKSDRVDLERLMEFCFPPGQQHPRSTGRLIVFSMYGPFNAEGELTCGAKGSHVVTNLELKCMVDEIEQEDILAVYVPAKGMSDHQKREVLIAADVAAKALPNMTVEQIRSLLSSLKLDSTGTVSFHDLQRLILRHRNRRLQEMKRMYPTVGAAAGAGKSSAIRKPPPSYGRKLGRPPGGVATKKKGTLTLNKKISDTETFKVVSKLLSSEVHGISHISDANASGLTQNVRLLKVYERLEEGGWDDNCCLKGTNRKVKK